MAFVYCIQTKEAGDLFSVLKALGNDLSWGTLYRTDCNEHTPKGDFQWRFVTETELKNPDARTRFSHDNPDNSGIQGYTKHDPACKTSHWYYTEVKRLDIEDAQSRL